MTDLQKEIDAALKLISDIPVTGDNQERAVLAKVHLRNAHKMATPATPKDSETEDSQDGQ